MTLYAAQALQRHTISITSVLRGADPHVQRTWSHAWHSGQHQRRRSGTHRPQVQVPDTERISVNSQDAVIGMPASPASPALKDRGGRPFLRRRRRRGHRGRLQTLPAHRQGCRRAGATTQRTPSYVAPGRGCRSAGACPSVVHQPNGANTCTASPPRAARGAHGGRGSPRLVLDLAAVPGGEVLHLLGRADLDRLLDDLGHRSRSPIAALLVEPALPRDRPAVEDILLERVPNVAPPPR